MPLERAPKKPLPVDYAPPGGVPYRVKDGDDWRSVAARNGIDVNILIYFNFHTNNTDEVNWYLHRNTGCNKPTKDGYNWTFSSSARPGIIYIPPRHITFTPEVVTARQGRKNRLADILDDADFEHHGAHTLHFILDAADWAIIGLEIAEVAGALAIAGPVVAWAGSFMALGMGHMEAIDHLKQEEYLSGLSHGVVLGADQVKLGFVRDHFRKPFPVYNKDYPEQGRNLQNAYNAGLVKGYAFGRELNTAESATLFLELYSHMNVRPKDLYGPDPGKWSNSTWEDYYRTCAAIFRRYHM